MDLWRGERGGGEAMENCNVLPLGSARTSTDAMLRDQPLVMDDDDDDDDDDATSLDDVVPLMSPSCCCLPINATLTLSILPSNVGDETTHLKDASGRRINASEPNIGHIISPVVTESLREADEEDAADLQVNSTASEYLQQNSDCQCEQQCW